MLFSVALRNKLTACLCHCNYTYGDLLFIQVCIDARPMHCSTGQGTIAPDTKALQHWSKQNEFPNVQCCSATQVHSMHFVTAIAPMEICPSSGVQ